jgi:predicted phage baseplate assembly protein
VWRWRRRLLDAAPFEAAFTVEPARYTDLRDAFERPSQPARWEYDGDDADAVRFGDGVFGERPPQGAVFDVTYRVTRGAVGNVAADTITGVDPSMSGTILRATNPFTATGGADEEPLDAVRSRAPYAFRKRRLRAVRAADYDEAAASLPWVLDAGTAFRWTGSWLTVFTTAQPRGGGTASVDEELQLVTLLDRRRLAGYDVYEPAPRYVGVDLVVTVCATPGALRGEVAAALLGELGTGRRRDGGAAFFAPDRFRFGTPLERSELEIAAQAASGVAGVSCVRYRRRGVVAGFEPMPETVFVGRDEIICVENDPSRPERGSLRIVVQGGK